MNPKYWLYADPNDAESTIAINIATSYFPQLILCSDFDQLKINIQTTDQNSEQNVVLLIQPVHTVRRMIWNCQIQELVSQPAQYVWLVNELFTIHHDILPRVGISTMAWASLIPNLLIVAPGHHNFGMQHNPWISWQHWLQDAADVYRHPTMQQYVDTLNPVQVKPMLFDILLGGSRPYRTMLHGWVEANYELSKQTIMTYYGGKSSRPSLIYEPDMVIDNPITHTGEKCWFRDIRTRFSVIPPVSIYQQTAYSIVTETSAQNNYAFFTEKIARVLFSKRLFIVFAGYKYLHHLRELGFRTFGNVINESYDLEVTDERRWRMAFAQMQVLANLDQAQVLEKIHPILEHNAQLLMTTNWHQQMADNVNQVIESRLQSDLKKV